jgi:hypothetical protein
MVTNAEIQQEVVELRGTIRQLREAAEAESQAPHPPPRKESKLPEPPEFDGKPPEYAIFINHCDLYFRMRPVTFDNKVAYVIWPP